MKYLPKNTLAHYLAAPYFQRHDLSEIPVSAFAASTAKYRETCGMVFPNDEALNFYALNHCAALVKKQFTKNEPLPPWAQAVMEHYLTVCQSQANRMLYYILSITTREMRWFEAKIKDGKIAKLATITAASNVAMKNFLVNNCQHDETESVNRFMTQPPAGVTVGQYLSAMSAGFNNDWWGENPGYGGPKWGVVADAALGMLTGKTSMEMLIDVGYTLAHNGGPIFNKGMMYTDYDGYFMTILDVQRSGQIPELVLDTSSYGPKITALAKKAVALVTGANPAEFRGWVDWEKVKAVAVDPVIATTYNKFIVEQKKKNPVVVAPVAKPSKKVATKLVGGKPVQLVGDWQVLPDLKVPVFKRMKAA